MKLTTRLFLLLVSIAALPAGAAALWAFFRGDGSAFNSGALIVAILFSLASSAAAALLISRRVISPINNMVGAVKKSLKNQRLDEVIPQDGWPEVRSLIGVMNRLMLELQAYRAFQLDQLVEERNKAQALVDTITDGVILTGDRGMLIYSNQTALKLLGISRMSAEAVLPASITNEAFLPGFFGLMESKEKFFTCEVEVRAPGTGGSAVKYYRIISNQFLLATLKRPGRVIIIRDITNEKALEKAKEDFFHMITHDMRSMLGTSHGYMELLAKKIPSAPDVDKYFKGMFYSSRRLRGMIDDILNTTKLQRGTMALNLDKISAAALLTRVLEDHESVAGPKKITMALAPSSKNIEFYGDPGLLERVIANLVGNSLKFTPGGGAITLGVSEGADEVRFWVEDTGPGVPDDQKERIFEKYSQMEEHKNQGFGLGLAMCRMTAALHHGRIWVESEPGRGSKFIFTVSKNLNEPQKA